MLELVVILASPARATNRELWHVPSPGTGDMYDGRVLKGEDIILLLKLVSSPGRAWTVRDLELATTIPKSSVQRALERLSEAGLTGQDGRTARVTQTEEFLLHGVRYVFPARLQAITRGVPAAWGAAPLAAELADSGEASPVWPHASGPARGPGLEPLHRTALNLRATDPKLAEALALVDGIRAGDARVRDVAGRLLSLQLHSGGV
jgi:hypothetical protein